MYSILSWIRRELLIPYDSQDLLMMTCIVTISLIFSLVPVGAMAIADLVKTTLGPKGMDKILQSMTNGSVSRARVHREHPMGPGSPLIPGACTGVYQSHYAPIIVDFIVLIFVSQH